MKKLIAEMKNAAEKATQGKWDHDQCGDVWSDKPRRATAEEEEVFRVSEMYTDIGSTPTAPNNPNAKHIATSSPINVLNLIEYVEELEGEVRLRAVSQNNIELHEENTRLRDIVGCSKCFKCNECRDKVFALEITGE
jgi:hypothetical protein